MLSVAARELNTQYPGKYTLRVYSGYPSLFKESPHFTLAGTLEEKPVGHVVDFSFDSTNCHQLVGVLDELDQKLGTDTRLSEFRPAVYLSPEMRDNAPAKGGSLEGKPYWLFATGGDYHDTTGWLGRKKWQEIIGKLSQREDFPMLVEVGSGNDIYRCAGLKGCVDLHGRTTLRELVWLVYHSRGVITVGSFLSHLAAALGKPCVVLAGGRLSRWYQGYTSDVMAEYLRIENGRLELYNRTRIQRFMDVVGTRPCCAEDACGKRSLGERGTECSCSEISITRHNSKNNIDRQAGCMAGLDVEWIINAVRWEDRNYKG